MPPLSQGTLAMRPLSKTSPFTNIGASQAVGGGLATLLKGAKSNINTYLANKNTPASLPGGLTLGNRAASPSLNLGSATPTLPKGQKAPEEQQPQYNAASSGQSQPQNNPTSSVSQPQYGNGPTGGITGFSGGGINYSPSGGAIIPQGGTQGTPVDNPPSQQTPNSQQPTSLVSLLQQLAGGKTASSATAQDAYDKAQQYQRQLTQSQMNEAGSLADIGNSPIPLEFQQGRANVLQGQYAAQQSALGSALQGESNLYGQGITSQGQQLGALSNAAGLSPEALRYSAFGSGGDGSTSSANQFDPQTQVGSLAKLVASGQMDFNSANSQIGNAYGPVFSGALRNAILQQNPNFNFNISQSSAQTQATGQQARTAIQPANQALDILQGTFSALPQLERTDLPILNQLSQGLSLASGAGRTATSNFRTSLQEARARIDAVLGPIIGVDAAQKQANALLPDNMVPTEVPQRIQTAKTYMQNQVDSYVQSGQQQGGATNPPTGSNTQSSGSLFSW